MQKLLPIAALPLATGCVAVNNYSLITPSQFSAPITDGSVSACLFVVAGCAGLLGGAIAWLAARSHKNAVRTQPADSTQAAA
jgi:hypothetical protein